jgi:hypothetical protein
MNSHEIIFPPDKMEVAAPNENIENLKLKAKLVIDRIKEITELPDSDGKNKNDFIKIADVLQNELGELNFAIIIMRRNFKDN